MSSTLDSHGDASFSSSPDTAVHNDSPSQHPEATITVEPVNSDAYQGLDYYAAQDPQDEVEDEPLAESEQAPFDATDFFFILLAGGLPGLLVGFAAGLLCAGLAVLINVVHNLLPVYVFVVPLFILLFMAIAPAVYGMGVGTGIGYFAQLVKSRSVGSASFAGLVWGIVGLMTFPYLAKYGMADGTIFFDDVLMPFVNSMVGAALHFEWLTEPKPANVSPSIVKYVWWGSGILGILCACGRAGEVVEDEATDEEIVIDL